MKKQVIKFTIMIEVLISKLICACLSDNIGIFGSSSSVFPIRWSTVLHQISHNFLITIPILLSLLFFFYQYGRRPSKHTHYENY